jgi:hypothetical protein
LSVLLVGTVGAVFMLFSAALGLERLTGAGGR